MIHISKGTNLAITSDLFKGAYFLCKGCDLEHIEFSKSSRRNETATAEFHITGPDIEKLSREYQSGQALVNPVQLKESLNYLRDILFQEKDERRRTARER